MSINWRLDVDPKPRVLVLPPAAASLDEAHAAIELWEFYKRRRLDDAQRLVVEMMMATTTDGLWAAPTTGREMPRQNGKGDEVEVAELWGLVQRGERILHTVHDAVLLATETQSRLLSVIDGHPDLRRLKERAWRGTGQQMIEMRNGGIIWYRTRTGGGARGVDEVDRIVVDEAQHAEQEHLAAITPTQLASTNPQLNAIGTAAIAGKSAWWWTVRRRALSADPGNFGYVGHTAEPVTVDSDGRVVRVEVDAADRGLWRSANPALVAGRVGVRFFEEQLNVLGPELFAREHLGVWDPEPGEGAGWLVIPRGAWMECARTSFDPGPVRYALDADVNAKGELWASVVASDGVLIEDVTPPGAPAGLSWVVPECVLHSDRLQEGIAVDPNGPAGQLIDELERNGIEVVRVKPADLASASAQLLDGVIENRVRHLDQPRLNLAAAAAQKRDVGDGAWKLSRKLSLADVGPLIAAAEARWLALSETGSVYSSREMVTL